MLGHHFFWKLGIKLSYYFYHKHWWSSIFIFLKFPLINYFKCYTVLCMVHLKHKWNCFFFSLCKFHIKIIFELHIVAVIKWRKKNTSPSNQKIIESEPPPWCNDVIKNSNKQGGVLNVVFICAVEVEVFNIVNCVGEVEVF